MTKRLRGSAARRNVVSFRLSDEELELAANKAGGRERISGYIRSQLFIVPPPRRVEPCEK